MKRQGSTLTEVLISVMVIGIGMTAIMTLFPLSVSRAIRANQATQATIHRYNAEEMIESLGWNSYWPFIAEDTPYPYVSVAADPTTDASNYPGNQTDDNGNLSHSVDNFQGNLGWLPANQVLPPNYDPTDPTHRPYGVIGVDPTPGYSDSTNVSNDSPIIDSDEVQYASRDSKFVVIDPLGWWNVGDVSTNMRNNFGYSGPYANEIRVPRINGGFRGNNSYSDQNPRVRPTFVGYNESVNAFFDFPAATVVSGVDFGGWGFSRTDAKRIVTLEDQFSTLVDVEFADIADISTIGPRTELTLPNTLAQNILHDVIANVTGGFEVRATFFGIQGTAAASKRVTYSRALEQDPMDPMVDTSRRITWKDNEPLPANFQIERVNLQSQLADFTWMVTARLPSRPPTRPLMDVIVFHKRRFEAIDEEPYLAARIDPLNRKVYRIDYGTSGQSKPWARKGSYLFDAENYGWYLITQIVEDGTTLTVTLDHDLNELQSGPGDNVNEFYAAFPRGIVDVFPIGSK